MNRIRERREAAGLTQEALAERVGTTGNHIWRLETGRSKLTHGWMTRLAEAMAISPADLIANVVAPEITDEVETVESSPVHAAIASRGLRVYRVTARSVVNAEIPNSPGVNAGVAPGAIIIVDESPNPNPRMGDIVLVEVGPRRNRVLRQYMPPGVLLTNRGGADVMIDCGDPIVTPEIVGIVVMPDGKGPAAS